MEILVVCTGNICRSPMAEALLRNRLARRGVEAEVRSAGLAAPDRPAPDEAVTVMRSLGLDVSAHRSRRLGRDLVLGADLVLAMERHHAREAMLAAPERLDRIFTVRELVRRGEAVGGRRADESLAAWLARAGAGRARADLVGIDPSDDVADPYGRSVSAYEETAAILADLVDRLVALAWPDDPPAGDGERRDGAAFAAEVPQ